jgi:hypothetical protein
MSGFATNQELTASESTSGSPTLPEFHDSNDDHQLDYAGHPYHSNCVKPLECNVEIRLVPIENGRYGSDVNGQRARHRVEEPFLFQNSTLFDADYATYSGRQSVRLKQDQRYERSMVNGQKDERRTTQEYNPN